MKAPKLLNPTSIKAVKGFEITPVFFKNSGGEVLRAEINPALPLGLKLTIDNKSCVISGTPLEFSANGIYLLTAMRIKSRTFQLI